jgi:hypothetical protein
MLASLQQGDSRRLLHLIHIALPILSHEWSDSTIICRHPSTWTLTTATAQQFHLKRGHSSDDFSTLPRHQVF